MRINILMSAVKSSSIRARPVRAIARDVTSNCGERLASDTLWRGEKECEGVNFNLDLYM